MDFFKKQSNINFMVLRNKAIVFSLILFAGSVLWPGF